MAERVLDVYEVIGSSPIPPTSLSGPTFMDFKIIYEDKDLLVVDKPPGIDVVSLGEELLKQYPGLKEVERNGIIHRLDKNTSGVILVAKSPEGLIFFQKQFKNRSVVKKYLALVVGRVFNDNGIIETLIGRSRKDGKKQKVYSLIDPGPAGRREAVTEYKVLQKYENYTLLEVIPKTGRKHQIRCHLAHIHYPVAGDEVYGFKGQARPKGLNRQFLHASYLKIKLMNGEDKEFESKLFEDLQKVIENL
jgi:23S rRNA pseudouridine1911/1915/1917 synthase